MSSHFIDRVDLHGKTIVITGASRGLGRAAMITLAERGAKVIGIARDASALQAVVHELFNNGFAADFRACDLANGAAVKRVINDILAVHTTVDVLVNNAGVLAPIGEILDVTPDEWANVIHLNLVSVCTVTQAVLPSMLRAGQGRIINLSSGAADEPLEGWSHYCASKAALKMFTRSLHLEYGKRGIVAVGYRPGTVATDMMASIKESGVNRVSKLDWSAHWSPEQAARGIVYLCSDAGADYAGSEFSIKTDEGRQLVGL